MERFWHNDDMGRGLDPRYGTLIFDNVPHAIFTVDEKCRITSFNRAAEEITGWRREQVLGRRCSEVLRSDHCEHQCFLFHSIQDQEARRDLEVQIVRRDGRELPVSVSTAALTDAQGHVVGGRRDVPRPQRDEGAAASGPGQLHLRGHRHEERRDEGRARHPAARRAQHEHRADRGRARDRQGAGGPGHPQPGAALGRAVRRRQLRRDPRYAGRVRAVRTRARGVHRRQARPAGPLRHGRRRDTAARRGRRPLARQPGHAAARPAGAGVHAARRGGVDQG